MEGLHDADGFIDGSFVEVNGFVFVKGLRLVRLQRWAVADLSGDVQSTFCNFRVRNASL